MSIEDSYKPGQVLVRVANALSISRGNFFTFQTTGALKIAASPMRAVRWKIMGWIHPRRIVDGFASSIEDRISASFWIATYPY
jgi:hypothetical protein